MWKPESGQAANHSKQEQMRVERHEKLAGRSSAFRTLGEKIENELRWFKLGNDADGYDVVAKLDNSGLPAKDIREIRALLVQRAEMALEDDLNPLVACHLLPQLGMEDRLRDRVKRGIRYGENSDGEVCFDYFTKGFKYLDEQERESYTDEFLTEYDFTCLESAEYFREERRALDSAFEKYCAKWNLPHVSLALEHVNAAQELMKEEYDLAVGVMNSGAPMTVMLECLGMSARYLEWHLKDWEGPPVWREIGRETESPKRAKKILVTENDTQTGATVEAIIPTLKELGPDQVDVTFLYDPWKTNEKSVKKQPFYGEAFQISDFNKKGVYRKLQDARKRLEAAVADDMGVVK